MVVVVVVVVAMAVADGKGVCSWFFDCEINYFIVLKAKIDPLLQHMCM